MINTVRRTAACAVVALFALALPSCAGGSGGGANSSILPVGPAVPGVNALASPRGPRARKVTITDVTVPAAAGGLLGGIAATRFGVFLSANGYYNPTADNGVLYANGTFTNLIAYDPTVQGRPTGAMAALTNGTVYQAAFDGPSYYSYPAPQAGLILYLDGFTKAQGFANERLEGTIVDMAGDTKGGLWYGINQSVYGSPATVFSFAVQVVLSYSDPTLSIQALGAGRNGDAWVATRSASGASFYHINSAGVILHVYAMRSGTNVGGVVVDSKGQVWFTDSGHNSIGKISRLGKVSNYPIPTTTSGADRITIGPDGEPWFTEHTANKIGHITTTLGHIREYRVPTIDGGPTGISSLGPGCNSESIWFVEQDAGKLGEIALR